MLVGYFLLLEMEFAVLEECLLLLDLELALLVILSVVLSVAFLSLLIDTAWCNPLLLRALSLQGISLIISVYPCSFRD